MTRVLIADEQRLVREGLRALLEREGFDIAGEALDGHEAVRLARDLDVEIAILDVLLPVLNGFEAAREIRRTCPKTRAILLGPSKQNHVQMALEAGVQGYVLKTQPAEDLVWAIREVAGGAAYLSPAISCAVIQACVLRNGSGADPLTARERQVLQLVAEGKTTKEIAVILDLSVKTADSHRCRIMKKLDIHDTAGLVRYAIRHGLIAA